MQFNMGVLNLLIALCVGFCVAERLRYDGYKVLRITPKTKTELIMLQTLHHSAIGRKLDFWTLPSNVTKHVDIMTSPTLHESVMSMIELEGLSVEVVIDNVQDLVKEEEDNLDPLSFSYNNYNSYDMIQQWISATAAGYATATEGSLGTSYEGRNIGYLKISAGRTKKAVVFHGGMHAREWISPATVIYMAKYLVEGGTVASNLLNKFDFYIIPVLNADGYAYTWSNDRFWRKTRKPNSGTDCVGTDPNRNFATGWGGVGSSDDPCAETYRGTSPFSEPEIVALRDLVTRLGGGKGVAMYIDYHAYSQYWLTPYGFTDAKPPNYAIQYAVAETSCTALKGVHGTRYDYGTVAEVIYKASGGSIDYMYAGQGVQFSYGLEGRDKGRYGFLLPACQIQPSAEENWAALAAACNFIYTYI